MIRHNSSRAGFALLMTLLVVAVVVSITVTIIELTTKQLALTVSAKDSEIAFHAANAGMECVQYTINTNATAILSQNTSLNTRCFGRQYTGVITRESDVPTTATNPAGATLTRYTAEISWNGTNPSSAADRCSVIDFLVMDTSAVTGATGLRINGSNLRTMYPGFEKSNKTCDPGSRCIIAEVTGYSADCTRIGAANSVRREILLEF